MAETLRIEIPIETVDETEPELSNLIKKIGKLGDEAEKAGQKTRKSSEYVSEFDKRAQKTEKSLASWAKEKYGILLEAKDRITPVLSTLGSGLRSFAGKTWSVTMRAVDFITSPVRGIINLLKNPVFQVGAVLGVSIGLKDTIETYKDFEAAMSQVQAISGATGSELTKLTNKAKEMGATTKFTAEESAEAFNYMAMAGWKTEDMLGGIDGILSLAAASGEDLATTSDIVTDALTAFGLTASDAGHFADVLAQASSNANTNVGMLGESFKYVAPVAGAMKYSVEDVSLALGLMANSSIKGSMAGTSLKTSLANLAAPTEKMQKYMDKYGISLTDTKGNMKTLREVMDNLRSGLGGLSEAEQTAAASAIFGKEAMAGMLSVINASETDYNKLAEAVNHADGAATQMSEIMLDNLQGSITILQSAVDGVKISFGERLSPYVRGIADWLTDQMPAVEQGLDEFMDWFDTKIDRMQRKFDEISRTKEWQDADFFGKVNIAWDEFIAEPFSKWWNSTGKAKFAEFAQDIGSGIGTGLKVGIMTLLGIDIGETLDEGVSIGASFAKGFSEGFDFDAVSSKLWEGFKNLLSNASKLLPGGESADLSSILSAAMLVKMVSPFVSLGKGAFSIGKTLFGSSGGGTSLVGSIIGSTGNQMVQGTGLLNVLSNAGYALSGGATTAGGYFGAGTAMSGGTAALAGAGSIAGGVIGGATLVSGAVDAYKAIKSNDEDYSRAYRSSAATKVGGVAAGAAIGTLILPGIGTLIGAGVGGIAGWIAGNNIKESYEEEIAAAEEKAQKAKAVFEATGMSMERMTKGSSIMREALKDTNTSLEEDIALWNELTKKNMERHFGDISLSLNDIKEVANKITFRGMKEEFDKFSSKIADSEQSFETLRANAKSLDKFRWKLGIDTIISEESAEEYAQAVDAYINSAKEYLDDKHYEATGAISLLSNGRGSTERIDALYAGYQEQLEGLAAQLREYWKNACADGILTMDEQTEIENLQKQIANITTAVEQAKAEAAMKASYDVLEMKFSGASLDKDSWTQMVEEVQNNVKEQAATYDEALEVSLGNLHLQFPNGEQEFENAKSELQLWYDLQMRELTNSAFDFEMNTLQDTYGETIKKIMSPPDDINFDWVAEFKERFRTALYIDKDAENWSSDFVSDIFGFEDMDPHVLANVTQQIKDMAATIPQQVMSEFAKDCSGIELPQEAIAEAERIGKEFAKSGGSAIEKEDKMLKTALKNAIKNASAGSFTTTVDVDVTANYKITNPFGSYFGKGSKSPGQELVTSGSGEKSYNKALSYEKETHAKTGLDGMTPNERILSNTVKSLGASKNAAGGYVSGGPQLSWLAEEGYGEFVIPTNPSRRSRALDLYEQAGAALGVSAHAAGGYVSGSILSDNAADYNLFNDANRYAPIAYNKTTEGNYDGEAAQIYVPVSTEGESSLNTAPVVSVSMAPEFVIHGSEGQSEEDIMQVIRRHMKEMADELGGEIAGKLEEVFSNMPLKEA